MNLTRRSFVAACATVTTCCMLSGCKSEGELDETAGAFDPSAFVIPPALGEIYRQAKAAAYELADDAVFMGVRPAHVTAAGETLSWDYLFASQRELSYYIVFTRSGAKAVHLGECSLLNTEWKALPDIETAVIDADKAYEAVCGIAGNAPAAENVYVYLSAYYRNLDTDAAMYEYQAEPMKWYFEFNVEDESSLVDGSAEGDAASSEAGGDGVSLGAGDDSSDEEGVGKPPMFVYSVDALTGEVAAVLE